jgi:hypothetical protein
MMTAQFWRVEEAFMQTRTLAIGSVLLAGMGLVFVSGLAAQEPSVADAARRAREQKSSAAKPAKIITDDTLAPGGTTNTTGGVSTVGTSSNATGDASASGAPQAAAPTGNDSANASGVTNRQEAEKEAAKDPEKNPQVIALKEELAKLQEEVDLEKRDLSLESDSYYSKPDYVHDKDGKTKLDGLADGVKVKQEDLEKLKAKLMEALASSGSGPKP